VTKLKDADLWAGVLFCAIGVAALVIGRNLAIGTAEEMGEGYVPRAMAAALLALGSLLVLVSAWKRPPGPERAIDGARLRPILLVTLAIVAFVAVAEPLGLLAAIAASVTVASFAGEPLRTGPLVTLIAALCAFVGTVFVWGLGLPLSLLPRVGG
jgi:putative tricarboxylic transport membrane protein